MSKRLEAMRANPLGNWTIADVEAVCREYGVICTPPTGGASHYKIKHESQADMLTVPFRRPIKHAYVRKLVRFIDEVREP
jgi:hypothetical protein